MKIMMLPRRLKAFVLVAVGAHADGQSLNGLNLSDLEDLGRVLAPSVSDGATTVVTAPRSGHVNAHPSARSRAAGEVLRRFLPKSFLLESASAWAWPSLLNNEGLYSFLCSTESDFLVCATSAEMLRQFVPFLWTRQFSCRLEERIATHIAGLTPVYAVVVATARQATLLIVPASLPAGTPTPVPQDQ